MKLEFSRQSFEKEFIYQVLSKSVQWEPSSTRTDRQTDRQTDMTKLIVAFRNFANAPEKSNFVLSSPCTLHYFPVVLSPVLAVETC
jgi:hypothetical protein